MKTQSQSFACDGFHGMRFSRRHVLKVGGLGLLGLTLPRLLQAEEQMKGKAPKARAKSVIFLYQFGGPSHLDMFDMKPDAPEGIRGPHKPMASIADGSSRSRRAVSRSAALSSRDCCSARSTAA